jgi:phage baseplate assembly protein W
MATVNTQISREYRDLDLNFTIHPIKKDINLLKGELAIINSMKNLILTGHYERPFQPDLGSNVRKMLFENIDIVTAAALEREIQQVIRNYEPRVNLVGVSVSPNPDENVFRVNVQFYTVNRPEPVSITFQLERLR